MNLVLSLEEQFRVQFTDVEMVEMLNYPLVVMTVRQAMVRMSHVPAAETAAS